MTTLQNLKQEIYRLCPELKELTFGCEVDESQYKNTRKVFVGRNEVEDENYFIEIDNVGNEDEQYLTEGAVRSKILGQPIQLNHVLRAVKPYKIDLKFDTRSSPYLFISDWTEKTVIWDLTKDLDGQSDEVVAFLSSVLIKEK